MHSPRTSFLYLDEPAMLQAGVLDTQKCVAAMEEMFRLVGQGDYIMSGHNQNSHGALITYPENSPFPNMPGPARTGAIWRCRPIWAVGIILPV